MKSKNVTQLINKRWYIIDIQSKIKSNLFSGLSNTRLNTESQNRFENTKAANELIFDVHPHVCALSTYLESSEHRKILWPKDFSKRH